jgi:Tol biopolymer transport system component
MTPERWREITEVFHAARAREPAARAAFLDEACARDPTLRAEVDAMLVADGATEVGGLAVGVAEEAPRLAPGTMVGAYRVESLIEAGGMGEVYRARDLRLGRDVAVKVLSESFALHPDRRARLEREARLLAALNHPRIAAIYELAEVEGAPALVLELVEGPTVADRLDEGPLPMVEALTLARQVAEALQAAHDKGIVHRDLKPANIKLARDGTAKVLDFGIAKVADASHPGLTHARLATSARTVEGSIVGTAGYMSPEQARGQAVDQRTDIWAFGCVLYEMLAGRKIFAGETLSDTIAAVLGREPDWTALPKRTPLHIRTLLRRCLQKDAARRPPDLAGAQTVIGQCLAGRRSPDWILGLAREWLTWKRGLPWLAALLILAAGAWVFRRADSGPRFTNPRQVTVATGVEDYPSWSPDNRSVVYESNQTGHWDIWVAGMGGGAPRNLTADHHGEDRYPSWSPDGSRIAFWSAREGGGYVVMPAEGGAVRRVASTPAMAAMHHTPAVWSADGTELASVTYQAAGKALDTLLDVTSLVTGETRRLKLPGIQESRLDLSWSRDGRFIAYVDAGSGYAETTQLRLLRLEDGSTVELTDARSNVRSPRWAPDGGALFFTSNRSGPSDLWRQRLDGRGDPQGDPQRVTAGVEIQHASFSADGSRLAYSKGRWLSNVWRVPLRDGGPATWADAMQITFEQAFIEAADLSPDGRRLAFSSDRMGNQDLWTMPAAGGEPVRVTDDPDPDWAPSWSPDGRQLAFYSNRTGDREIFVIPAAGGPARQLTSSPGLDAGTDWSPDGNEISFRSERTGSSDIWVVSADGERLRQLTAGPAIDYFSHWSPDGRWMGFTSNMGGTRQIWRVPAAGGAPERLSRGETQDFVWSVDGTGIYYVGGGEQSGNLWWLSLETRNETPVTDLRGRRGALGAFALATDGRWLYFTWREDVGDIWVMDVAPG